MARAAPILIPIFAPTGNWLVATIDVVVNEELNCVGLATALEDAEEEDPAELVEEPVTVDDGEDVVEVEGIICFAFRPATAMAPTTDFDVSFVVAIYQDAEFVIDVEANVSTTPEETSVKQSLPHRTLSSAGHKFPYRCLHSKTSSNRVILACNTLKISAVPIGISHLAALPESPCIFSNGQFSEGSGAMRIEPSPQKRQCRAISPRPTKRENKGVCLYDLHFSQPGLTVRLLLALNIPRTNKSFAIIIIRL